MNSQFEKLEPCCQINYSQIYYPKRCSLLQLFIFYNQKNYLAYHIVLTLCVVHIQVTGYKKGEENQGPVGLAMI
jgi:hypothetical protein